ncbi:unnamed protein product [Symbiodinium necroappetens]|uniref:Uncharacterized protein n=1 Tax=Symbiodinium necroappetens TaxID=1628268 RepID=A0A812YHE5_9DINO|nr:unnamed protein product [Symbiodinium necroappetens]
MEFDGENLRPGISACMLKRAFKGGDEYKFCWCLLTGRELQRAAVASAGKFHSEELPILFPMSSPEIDPTEASNLGEPWPP